MNVMFVINGKLITPQLTSAILDGVTRDSILTLAREEGIEVEENRISVDELIDAFENGTITEAFGAGTAAVIAPIATIGIHGKDYNLPQLQSNSVQERIRKNFTIYATVSKQMYTDGITLLPDLTNRLFFSAGQ